MKFQCTGCGQLVEASGFRLDGQTLVLRCGVCGRESSSGLSSEGTSTAPAISPPMPHPRPSAPKPVLGSSPNASNVVELKSAEKDAIAAAAKAGDPTRVPVGLCVKCVSPRRGSGPCPHCGLDPASPFDAHDFAPTEPVLRAFKTLLSGWGDSAAHTALRNRARESGDLAALGRLYRLRLAAQPGDPYATAGLDEVVRLALMPSQRAPVVEPDRLPAWKVLAVGLFFAACLAAVVWMARVMMNDLS